MIHRNTELPPLPAHTSVGSYPIVYLDPSDNVLCAHCATEEESIEESNGHINWEDPDLYCDECSERIESAYAEPESEEAS